MILAETLLTFNYIYVDHLSVRNIVSSQLVFAENEPLHTKSNGQKRNKIKEEGITNQVLVVAVLKVQFN